MALIEHVPQAHSEVSLDYLKGSESSFGQKCQLIATRSTSVITNFTSPLTRESITDYFIPACASLATELDTLLPSDLSAEERERESIQNLRLAQIAFGPLALPSNIAISSPDKHVTLKERIYSASLQQETVLAIMAAKSSETPPAFREMIHQILLTQQEFGQRTNEPLFKSWWAGVRNEVGLIQMLQEMNMLVYVLNPVGESRRGKDNPAIMGDVRHGIDVIGVNPFNGTILLVDARSADPNLWRRDARQQITGNVVSIVSKTDLLAQDIISEIVQWTASEKISDVVDKRKILSCDVYLPPTSQDAWVRTVFYPDMDIDTFFEQWGRISPYAEDSLIHSLVDFMSNTQGLLTENFPHISRRKN